MKYIVPNNVERNVRRKREELKELVYWEMPTGCSLQNLERAIERTIAEGDMETRVGCVALGQRVCYLVKGTKKQPQVLSREECPVYQRVRELLY